MEEQTKVDKDYIEAFNQGYEVAKELGLKPEEIESIKAGKDRMRAMKEGMEQYQKEIELEKDKNIIPPFDMDSFDNSYIDLTPDKEDKDKDIDIDM
ncbi:hypothetical protein N1F78_00960 [Seonamhaeicola sp. MEBiC1930]|uniref:hypothetical protein n=1 Tax=Seonamhaeicola sp. MEBiC01930 TaxID=2976768 RepID=UPI0032561038